MSNAKEWARSDPPLQDLISLLRAVESYPEKTVSEYRDAFGPSIVRIVEALVARGNLPAGQWITREFCETRLIDILRSVGAADSPEKARNLPLSKVISTLTPRPANVDKSLLVPRVRELLTRLDKSLQQFGDVQEVASAPSRSEAIEAAQSLALIGLRPAAERLQAAFDEFWSQVVDYHYSLAMKDTPSGERHAWEEIVGPIPDPDVGKRVWSDRKLLIAGRASSLSELVLELQALIPHDDPAVPAANPSREFGLSREFLERLDQELGTIRATLLAGETASATELARELCQRTTHEGDCIGGERDKVLSGNWEVIWQSEHRVHCGALEVHNGLLSEDQKGYLRQVWTQLVRFVVDGTNEVLLAQIAAELAVAIDAYLSLRPGFDPKQLSKRRHPGKAVLLGDRKYQVNDGAPFVLQEGEDFVLRSLIDLGGAADKPTLVRQTGKDDAPRVLRRIRAKYSSLAPFIVLPGRKGKGGYQTEIGRPEKSA